MIIKYFYYILALIAFWFYFNTNSYFNELAFLDEWKTIKELKENIDYLDKTKVKLNEELKELKTDYKLKLFLKKDLKRFEINKIKFIVSEYNKNTLFIENTLELKAKKFLPILEEKKLLLEEKRKLYSGLIPYINPIYKKDYLNYIKDDTRLFSKQKSVSTDIIIKKEILNNKVDIIETKIKEYNDYTNQNIKKVINSKLEEKINNLNNNENFKILSSSYKRAVLDKTIQKIKLKLLNLEKLKIDSSKTMRIETYNIAIEKLEKFRDSISEKKN